MASKVSTTSKLPSRGLIAPPTRFSPPNKPTGKAAPALAASLPAASPRLAVSQSTRTPRPHFPAGHRAAQRVHFAPVEQPKPVPAANGFSLQSPRVGKLPAKPILHQTEARPTARSTATNTDPQFASEANGELESARVVASYDSATGLPRLPVERALYERIVRTYDISQADEVAAVRRSYALDWWVDSGTRGGRLHIDDREMHIDDESEPEWNSELQDGDTELLDQPERATQKARSIGRLGALNQKVFGYSDPEEDTRIQSQHLHNPKPSPQQVSSQKQQLAPSELEFGVNPKQRVYDMNPVGANIAEQVGLQRQKSKMRQAKLAGPPASRRPPKPQQRLVLQVEQQILLHKLRTPLEASIGCSGLCAGPGGRDGELFFNDPVNLCVKSISFANKKVRHLFSYSPEDTVRALILAAGRGPPPGTLVLAVLHEEQAPAEQSHDPLFKMELISICKAQSGSGAVSSRAATGDMQLWNQLGMVELEPQVNKEHVTRAVNLVVLDAPSTAPLALTVRSDDAGGPVDESFASNRSPGNSVCLCLCGLVGNPDLHVVSIEDLGAASDALPSAAAKGDVRKHRKPLSAGFPVQSLVSGRVDGASAQLVFALESATHAVHALRVVYDLSSQTSRLEHLYTVSIQGDLLLLLGNVLMCAQWNVEREISAVAACQVAAVRDRCAPLGQLLREEDCVDIAWWCALPNRERDSGRVVVYDLKQNSLLIMSLRSSNEII